MDQEFFSDLLGHSNLVIFRSCGLRRETEHRWSCLSMLVDASLALAQSDQAEANRNLAGNGELTCKSHRSTRTSSLTETNKYSSNRSNLLKEDNLCTKALKHFKIQEFYGIVLQHVQDVLPWNPHQTMVFAHCNDIAMIAIISPKGPLGIPRDPKGSQGQLKSEGPWWIGIGTS